jgi:hypothetical protein
MKKQNTGSISFIALALPMLMIGSLPASAEYSYQMIGPPGGLFSDAWGNNNAGMVAGHYSDGISDLSFIYDMKRGEYRTIDSGFLVYGISNNGVMVGDVGGVCAIRDKKDNITEFYPPSFGPGSICIARDVNSNDKVSGFLIDNVGGWLGFIYDSRHGTYEEFLPSFGQTIAQGINAQGDNVGSVVLDEGEAYEGSLPGRYGYFREADGSVKYFGINQGFPDDATARGISDSGLVTGFYLDQVTFEYKSYVTTLSSGTEFENIELTDDQMVHVSPCDSDLEEPPPGYEAGSDVFAQQIRNDGVVVGTCQDYFIRFEPFDFFYVNSFGFIATPIK